MAEGDNGVATPSKPMYLSGGKIQEKPLLLRAQEFIFAIVNLISFFFMSMVPGQGLEAHKKVLEQSRKGGGGGGPRGNIHGGFKDQGMGDIHLFFLARMHACTPHLHLSSPLFRSHSAVRRRRRLRRVSAWPNPPRVWT